MPAVQRCLSLRDDRYRSGPILPDDMDWPFVGRDRELARIEDVLTGRESAAVVVVGPAGVGKTRLAEVALDRAEDHEELVIERAAATEASRSIPFGALSHLLPAEIGGASDRFRLLQQARRALTAAAESSRLVMGIDDAHLLDDGSATLVHQLVAAEEATAIVTVRTGEATPDAVRALWKDRVAVRIELSNLPRERIDELISTSLDGPVTPRVLDELWELSRGNPLYLRELLRDAWDRGVLVRDEHGQWQAKERFNPSRRLTEIVQARLAELDESEREAVELLTLGQPLGLSVMEQLTSPQLLEDLERRGLLDVSLSNRRARVQLAHPLYSDVIRADMPVTRLRRLAGRLADAVTATGARRREDLLRLATWRLDAGGPADPDLFLVAARRSLEVFDVQLAERLARAALHAGGEAFEVCLTLGKALARQGRAEEARELLSRATDLASGESQFARASLAIARLTFFGSGRRDEARALLRAALDEIDDEDWRDQLEALRALFTSVSGDLSEAAEVGRRIKDRPDASPRVVRATLSVATVAEVWMGRFADAEESITLGLAAAPSTDDGRRYLTRNLMGAYRAGLDAYAGRIQAAVDAARDGFGRAAEQRMGSAGIWGVVCYQALVLRGKPAQAADVARRILSALGEHDPFGNAGLVACAWAYACALRREVDEAERLLDRVEEGGAGRDVPAGLWELRARARLAVAGGDMDGGAELAGKAGWQAADGDYLVWAAMFFHDAVRFGHTAEAVQPLTELAGRVEGDLVATMARHGELLAAGDIGGLEKVVESFNDLGATLLAAETAVQTAEGYRETGAVRRSRRLMLRAAKLIAACEDAWTPAFVAPDVRLTTREREVALLAADGLTSQQVADRLVISRRTVDNHLRKVYAKLGIEGRDQLAEVL